MRVLHIIDHLGLGGAQSMVSTIARNERRDSTDVFVLRKKSSEHINPAGVTVSTASAYPNTIAAMRELLPLVRKRNVSIIHAHLTHSLIVGVLLKKLNPTIKLVYHEHGAVMKDNLHRLLLRMFQPAIDVVIAISEGVKNSLLEQGIHGGKVVRLHNFIDDVFFTKHDLASDEKRGKYYSIGFAGRIVASKGWREFVEAVFILKNQTSIRALIAGDGRESNQLKSLISKHGKMVAYLGRVADMRAFFCSLDCFVMPSHIEPMGLTHLEAQATGVPVIASNLATIREVLKHEHDALLVDPHSPESIARAVIKVKTDRRLREYLIKNGFTNAQKYTYSKWRSRLESIYKSTA